MDAGVNSFREVGMDRSRRSLLAALALLTALPLGSCEYFRLLRPSVLKQLNPDVVRLVNELPAVDDPNGRVVARLFAHGGLGHARRGRDGLYRARVWVPVNQFIWKPAIIVMQTGGELEVEFQNADQNHHMVFMPSQPERQVLDLPPHTAGKVRVRLDQPGLYWFGCPVSDHAGRGMLGLVMVGGEVPAAARLDRPRQRRP
jgi:PQQ system protein